MAARNPLSEFKPLDHWNFVESVSRWTFRNFYLETLSFIAKLKLADSIRQSYSIFQLITIEFNFNLFFKWCIIFVVDNKRKSENQKLLLKTYLTTFALSVTYLKQIWSILPFL